MNNKENPFDSLVIFSDKLRQFKIPIDRWGQKRAKTVENLYNEIISRESDLVVINEVLVRELAFVNIDVFATINDKRYRLREDKQVFNVNSANERTRIRKLGGAVKEKIQIDEEPDLAVKRAFQEELQIFDEVRWIKIGQTRDSSYSPSYPGLLTRYDGHHYLAELSESQFKKQGYMEVQEDKTTYFVWDEVSE